MAAGTSSRFVPLSEQTPKGLLEVRGEILIERQIRQLHEAGIRDITVVVGYKAEMFGYLREKFGVRTVMNEDYARFNNTSSLVRVLDRLEDTFICCSDHYFTENVFKDASADSYYSALFSEGKTGEYCLETDDAGWIKDVQIGGEGQWYMAGHVYFNKAFSSKFRSILSSEYENEKVRKGYWEDLYISHIGELPMKMKKYSSKVIHEFDSLDELRLFDPSYIENTRSSVLEEISRILGRSQAEMTNFRRVEQKEGGLSFSFNCGKDLYLYDGLTIRKM